MQHNLMQLSGVDLVVPTHGLEGAKAYPLGLNCRVPLFDDEEDVFYIKSTDANGFPTVKKYRFTEEILVDPNNNGNGVALQDIRSMVREELLHIKEELLNAQQSVPTTDSTAPIIYGATESTVVEHNGASTKRRRKGTGTSAVEYGEEQQQSAADV